MLLFSALLYWRGEQVAYGFRYFATRLAAKRGDAAVLLAGQAVRAVALGVVVTALHQAVLGGLACRLRRALRRCLLTVGDDLLPVWFSSALYWFWCRRLSGFTGAGITTWGTVLRGLELRSRHHGQRYSSGAHPHAAPTCQ